MAQLNFGGVIENVMTREEFPLEKAREILKDETIANNREAKIQRLVDFVSNEIQYDYSEAVGGRETLKRPNEVLFTRSGDCSNKTILLASLLEQIGEDLDPALEDLFEQAAEVYAQFAINNAQSA